MQIDNQTGAVLQVEYRRSDLIEAIHDGSFFHEHAKLWLFLPVAVVVLVLWITGMYMFLLPFIVKRNKKQKAQQRLQQGGNKSLKPAYAKD